MSRAVVGLRWLPSFKTYGARLSKGASQPLFTRGGMSPPKRVASSILALGVYSTPHKDSSCNTELTGLLRIEASGDVNNMSARNDNQMI